MEKIYDLIIVGAGPGGLQVALTLKELAKRADYDLEMLILEAGKQAGTFYTQFPVHGQLISNNKLYTGSPPESRYSERFDWNSLITSEKKILMRNYSRDFFPKREALVSMLNDLVQEYELPVQLETQWEGTRKDSDGNFVLATNKGEYRAKYLVIATGQEPRMPAIPGLELVTMYKDMREKEFYRDKRVLILGKGNSAFECAQDILNEANLIMLASPNSTKLAYKTHYVGHVRAVNMLLVDNYQLKHQAALLDCNIVKIEQVEDGFDVTVRYNHAENETETLFFNEVIVAAGFKAKCSSLIVDLGVKFVYEKYPSITQQFESTEVDNLFFAGTQTHSLDYRKTFSGFIHGFRYNSKVLAHILAERLKLPVGRKIIERKDIVKHILTECTEAPDIYLQPGFLVNVFADQNGAWTEIGYRTLGEFEMMPFEAETSALLAVSLEYGDIHKFADPLSIPRVPGNPNESVHIHPVMRARTADGSYHRVDLEEHLENSFMNLPTHHRVLAEFLNKLTHTTLATI